MLHSTVWKEISDMPLRAIEEARKTVYGIVSLSNEKE